MTVAEKIVEVLNGGYDRTNIELASELELNPHTVRRTTRELAVAGVISEYRRYRGQPVYVSNLVKDAQTFADSLDIAL